MTTPTRTHQLWVAGGVGSALLVAALAWFVLIGPQLAGASSLKDQTVAAQDQNAVLQHKVSRLQAQNANIAALTESLRQARVALPVDSGLPDFTRQVAAQAAAAGVSLTSISAGTPASAEGTAAAAAKSIAAAGHLFGIPVTVVGDGSIDADRALLHALQNGGRRVLVQSSQLSAASEKGGAQMTLTAQLTVFVAPQTPAAEAALRKQLAGS